jgi:uncharacterized protein (TIGR02421 family)
MITDEFTDDVLARLANNQRVRRNLPDGGRLHIDRPLPFLCLYRDPGGDSDSGTRDLVKGEASFIIASGSKRAHAGLAAFIRRLSAAMAERFGAFLIVEVWSAPDRDVAVAADTDDIEPTELRPDFALTVLGDNTPQRTIAALVRGLQRIAILKQPAHVATDAVKSARPPGMSYIFSRREAARSQCTVIGMCVRPIYRDHESGELFPTVLRNLKRGLGRALKQTFFTFAKTRTNTNPEHFYSLGRRAMVKAVWEMDRRLSEISDSFDFLLQVTPVNAEGAWREFRRRRFDAVPRFYYRPLAVEPTTLKRRLYDVPIENIEDPTLGELFRQRQDELDRKITMLTDIGTRRFLLGSRQVFGDVNQALFEMATNLLATLSAHSRGESSDRQLSAEEFAERAREEVAHYRRQMPSFTAEVSVREDMFSGLLCSQGHLLIGHQTKVPSRRVLALLQHEVGTHLVTYYNALSEPFQQLHSGFAGYDALQEGLAVLSEYLVGGLSKARLRLLAARVVAARWLIDGASFIDTFRQLNRTYGFAQRTAYTITMRTFRGGGLTKDAVYLRGLAEILNYLRDDGHIAPLFIGKIAAQHIPLIQELQHRKVLGQPKLRPRYLDIPGVDDRLNSVRNGLAVSQLAKGPTP